MFPLSGQMVVLLIQGDLVNFVVSAHFNYILFEHLPNLKD